MRFSQLPTSRAPRMNFSEARNGNGGSHLVGANGQLNASSVQDLLKQQIKLMQALASGEVSSDPEGGGMSHAQMRQLRVERAAALQEAYYDRQDRRKWEDLGAAISGQLAIQADRDGFMRRILSRQEVVQGTTVRHQIKTKDATAMLAPDVGKLYPQYVAEKYINVPEFYIKGNLRVEERELAQGTGDILEDKFLEAQEQILVVEDRQWKIMVDATVGIDNQLQIIAGGLTPDSLAVMRDQVMRWGLSTVTLLMANDIVVDLNGTTFGSWFDPISQAEIVMTGMLGTLMGLAFITDAYRDPTLRVLNQGDLYILTTPEYHGAYTDRGPVSSTAVDNYADGEPSRGWSMFELVSMCIHNTRSVVKATVSR